jgi:hypothetical protein
MTTLRCLRAVLWLRWRLIKNSMVGGRKRDALEQMSRALALIVPFLIVALSAGTFLAVSVVGFVGGRMMASGLVATAPGLLVVRLLVGLMVFLVVSLSVVSPTQSTLSRYTRLLLLPIPRRVMHLVEVAASLGDPWVAVVAAGLTTFAAGLYSGGRPGVGLAALAAAGLMVAVVVCAAALASFLVAWLMRDRRRGEMLTLVFVLAFSLLSFIPAFMSRSLEEPARDAPVAARARPRINVEEFDRNLPGWTHYLPSEIHGRTIAAGLAGERPRVLTGLGTLLAEAVLLFMASGAVHRQMLNSLEGDQLRRRKIGVALMGRRLPLLSPGSSAVAWALTRGAFRTVRGRLTILLPGPLLAMLTAVFQHVPRETWTAEASARGYLLFGGSLIFTFYAMHAISMNLFGSDRAGLTLQLLVPVSDRELVRGKLVGFAAVIGTGTAVCLVAAAAVAHTGSLSYWLAVLLGAGATFLLVSPLAIWCSALFPVASDLSKTGAGGNPHPFAMIAGTFGTALCSLPTVVILALAEFWLKSPAAALLMAAAWLAVAAAVGVPLVNLASRAVGARRENLALVAQGK